MTEKEEKNKSAQKKNLHISNPQKKVKAIGKQTKSTISA